MHTVLLAISLLVVSVIGQRVEPFDKNITIPNGNDVDLECVISGVAVDQFLSWTRITETDSGGVTSDIIAFNDQLTIDGSDPNVPNSPARYRLIKTSTRYTIEIDDAKMEDEGKFECSISGTDQKQAVWLTVKTVPEIDRITDNFFAHENKTYELKCTAFGSPKPSIVWSRPGDMLPSGEYLSHGSILELVNMSSSHRGVYQCAASNTEGSVKRTVEITMDHKPEVTVVKEVVLAWPGETASLTCLFEANPSASLTQWIKVDSGRTINESPEDGINVDSNESETKLSFEDVKTEDFGEYRCEIRNPKGKTSKIIRLDQNTQPMDRQTTTKLPSSPPQPPPSSTGGESDADPDAGKSVDIATSVTASAVVMVTALFASLIL